eukprot:g24467.t1
MADFLDDLHNPQTCSATQRLLEELEVERQELGQIDCLHLLQPARLTRFLQGNNGSVEEAAAHFRRMLTWYREADMPKKRLLVEGKDWSVDSVEGGKELFRMMCIDASKKMADGTMLWVQRDGLVQIDEIMSLSDEDYLDSDGTPHTSLGATLEDLVHRMSLLCELRQIHLDGRSEETGHLAKFIQVRDLTGLNITAVVRNRAVMKRLADVFKIISTAFPETLTRMIIVNPPAGFNMLWMAVQPMLNQRIKQKFVFIPDGVFEFPQKLAAMVGTAPLQALADLGATGPSDFCPGHSNFRYRVLSPGCKAQWSFEIQPPGCSLQLQVIFFEECEDGRSGPVVHEVFPVQPVSGAVSGHCGPLGLSGLLWFTWYNDSWTSTMQVKDLKISVNSSGEDELLRNPSQHQFPDFSHDPPPPREKVPLLYEDPPCSDCGWEGGLGSPAFQALMLRLAALVLLIATAQTARKYISLVQENGYVPIAPFLVSKAEVGLLLSAQAFAGCAALIPAGLAIDRLGAKAVLQWAVQVAMLGLLVASWAPSFPGQFFARLILGASLSANFNASMALIMEHYQDALIVSVALSTKHLQSLLGNMVGPPSVGFVFDLAKKHSLPLPYFWALVHPMLLLVVILWLLRGVPEATLSEPLVKAKQEQPLVQKAFAVYLSAGAPAVVLALELVSSFGSSSAFLTAGATEMHRMGFASTHIGLAAVPASMAQSVTSWWAGWIAGEVKHREKVLLGLVLGRCTATGTPFAYATLLLLIALGFGMLPPAGIMVLTLALSSAANGMLDAPSISMMADLARARNLGYGQAVTASEMAVALGLALGPSVATVVMHRGSYGCLSLLSASVALLVGLAATANLRHVPRLEEPT